jgi:DNA-directed RNA polymerase sigma subunit (sigma70/sigma32)
MLDEETATLEEIGQELGVCRERVRQIEALALQTLKKRFAFGATSAEEWIERGTARDWLQPHHRETT